MRHFAFITAGLMIFASEAHGQTLTLPASFFVDATSASGSTFNFSNVSSNALLSFSITGTPTLQYPSIYGTNAAGVVTIAGSSGVGQSSVDPSSGFTFGSLIVSLNGTTSRQVFATTAANGLGSATPPTAFTYSNTLASLFGLSAGTILGSASIKFKVDDNFYTDNTSGFTISGAAGVAGAAPEPATWAMMILGLSLVGFALRHRQKVTTRFSYAC